MSKTVRVSDEVFSRLQDLAEPFIDNPSTVIGKLLDYYEARHSSRSTTKRLASVEAPIPAEPQTPHEQETTAKPRLVTRPKAYRHRNQNLFLAPAPAENIAKSITRPVSYQEVGAFLSDNQKRALTERASDLNHMHCWAITESNRSKFDAMQEDDIVLFTVVGTGKFEFYGRVIYKTDNAPLGSRLWDIVPGKPWSLIYFLEDIRRIDIDKRHLVTELGYAENYQVPGFTRVSRLNLDVVLAKFACLDDFIDSLSR